MIASHQRIRRRLIKAGVASLGFAFAHSSTYANADRVLIGTTPVFLDDQLGFLEAWREYLQARLNRPVGFVQRGSYREVADLLLEGSIDCAWLCGFPYVRFRERLQLVVVPAFLGVPLYRSYMIVPVDQTQARSLIDMRGHSFAFSDPLSNSGFLVPRYTLWSNNIDPDRHFSRTLFTLSHKKVVEAVSVGLVDGGSVDGYVWETLAKTSPEQTRNTRVAWKSKTFGFPPIVASRRTSPGTIEVLRNVFLGMSEDDQGKSLLARLNLNGFVVCEDKLFDPIAQMMHALMKAGKLL